MGSTRRRGRNWIGLLTWAVLLPLLPGGSSAAELPAGSRSLAALGSGTYRAPKSKLPYTPEADLWVDAAGAFDIKLSGVPEDAVSKARVVIFQPKDDRLSWESYTALYVTAELLKPAPKPELTLSGDIPGVDEAAPGVVNAKESNVYLPAAEGDRLVLGFVRNQKSRNLLVYGVLLTGKADNTQALIYARKLVDVYAGKEGLRRAEMKKPPVPEGAVKVRSAKIDGANLQQLAGSIQRDPNLSNRVKQMARVVIPQATGITLDTWNLPGSLSDGVLAAFYSREGVRRGWGPPITQDLSRPGQPTFLFERPDGGMVMIRATYGTITTPLGPRPGTIIVSLEIEGPIDPSALRGF